MYKDLAPDITRQRIVIEGTLHNPFLPEQMDRYCREMTSVLNMTVVTAPFCNYDPAYGWCSYVHWKESGCMFMHGTIEVLASFLWMSTLAERSNQKLLLNTPKSFLAIT